MSGFVTTPLLITDYYDSLISQLDIYTEERINEYRDKNPNEFLNLYAKDDDDKYETVETYEETYGIETLNNPYKSQKYSIDRIDISEITEISQAEEYMNNVRQKAIEEIRKVQDENLKYYKANKEKFKVDKENLKGEKLEELKSQLFAKKFCFLVERRAYYKLENSTINIYSPLFNLHTVITDFYVRESDIDYIKIELKHGYKIKHRSTKLDKSFLIANQLQKYIKETLDEDLNGYEVLHIKQKTLFEIQHIKVCTYIFKFKETYLSSFDLDLSAIKSLILKINYTVISDVSSFVNLEYLSISGIILCQSPFQNLRKLIKLQIYNCDLFDFDFDSLNSLTSLQIIEIDETNISEAFDIDLNILINLKWLDLRCSKNQVVNNLELITNSYNQLTKIRLSNKTIDFSNQLDLPVLKCFDISSVNLSYQITKQWFNCMSNLIELYLFNTNLTYINFLDTDRLENLEILDLSSNQITVLRKGAFNKLNKLETLFLSDNRIKELVPGVFEGLECLEHLNISSNRFNVESIDKTVFDGLKCLTSLFIRCSASFNSNVDYLKRDGLFVY